MANTIKLKRSSVRGKVPLTSNLDLNELALNTADGRLFLKKNNGTESIVPITNKANLVAGNVILSGNSGYLVPKYVPADGQQLETGIYPELDALFSVSGDLV